MGRTQVHMPAADGSSKDPVPVTKNMSATRMMMVPTQNDGARSVPIMVVAKSRANVPPFDVYNTAMPRRIVPVNRNVPHRTTGGRNARLHR